MRRGLVVFGDRVLVVAHPSDDRTPQHIVAIDSQGRGSYLQTDGTFASIPVDGTRASHPATLRGEGLEADYADGLLALLNSDSLSDWTDSGFLDWGSGATPAHGPSEWSTQVPLVWRESHQRSVAVLGPDAGQQGSLIVGHVGRLYRDAERRQPVQYPSAMMSLDRGRSWTWSPEVDGLKPPAGAYAAAWPDAPGGGVLVYFVHTLPDDEATPPLAAFRLDSSEPTGVTMDIPYASPSEFWGDHRFTSEGRTFAPHPVRHWVTRWGLIVETITEGLFWMDAPDARPQRVGSLKQRLDQSGRTLYFEAAGELMRVDPSGQIERLDDPAISSWTPVGEIDRPPGTRWLQAASSDHGALWLLGVTDAPEDVSVATWPPGEAF